MTISYNLNIPNAPNNPSNDQPLMKTNTNAIDSLLQVDHYSFNTTNFSGNHLQIHLGQYTSPSIVNAVATQGSVIYSAAGTADNAHAQCLFLNANNLNFLMSGIRAFALVNSAGSIVASQSQNVASVSKSSTGIFNVTLTTNAVSSTNYLVIISSTQGSNGFPIVGNYIIQTLPSFQLQFLGIQPGTGGTVALRDPVSFSFLVVQI